MATLDDAALQLADSLPIEAVPAKLRCGSCNKLAVNAVKLPCCDQSICGPCSLDLPEACPICSHSPLSGEDCKPNKSLRMTVKAFIKNEEKKRSKDTETPAPQPIEAPTPMTAATATPAPAATDAAEAEGPVSNGIIESTTIATATPVAEAKGQDDGLPAILDGPQANQEGVGDDAVVEDEEEEDDDDDDVVITTERPEYEEHAQKSYQADEAQDHHGQDEEQEQYQTNGQHSVDFGQNQQGFGNMDFSNMNNFNPMMAMQNMQNGMGMPGFGMQNMMGMPPMNMDPSMMFNGGFGGMGDMSAMMNQGWGMNGMGGGFNGMQGMNGGGFNFPGNGGRYNQQNYGNHMMNQNSNFYPHRGGGYGRPYYNNRGFGRGRGNYYNRGRGGWQNQGYGHQQGQYQNFNQQNQYQQQQQPLHEESASHDASVEPNAQQGARRGSPSYEPMNTEGDGHAADTTNHTNGDATNLTDAGAGDEAGATAKMTDGDGFHDVREDQDIKADSQSMLVESMDDEARNQHRNDQGNGLRGVGGSRGGMGGSGGRGGAYGTFSTLKEPEPAAPPINAPTGPKAMRDGLPNSGRYSRPAPLAPIPQPEAGQSKPVQREDRSRSRDRARPERRGSRVDEHEDSDEAYARRKDRERRKRKEREDEIGDEDSGHKLRSRSESRDRDHSKRRHRDKDEGRHSSRSRRDKSRERRKHRHRSRSPDRDSSVNEHSSDPSRRKHRSERRREDDHEESERSKDKDRSRKHSRRDEDRAHESKDRSHKSSKHTRSVEEVREREKHKPVLEEPQDDIGFKIKGSKSASLQQQTLVTSMGPPTTSRKQDSAPATPIDHYALEREKAMRDRENRETERLRRQSSTHSLGKRVSRDDDEFEAPTGPKGDRADKRSKKDARRHSLKYEGEI